MSITAPELLLYMAIAMFCMGVLSFFAGTIVLLIPTRNKDIHTLAVQTNRLAQKGLLDGVAGLVGNASSLLDAVNQLVKTTTGIGVFFVLSSFILIGTSLLILIKLF